MIYDGRNTNTKTFCGGIGWWAKIPKIPENKKEREEEQQAREAVMMPLLLGGVSGAHRHFGQHQ